MAAAKSSTEGAVRSYLLYLEDPGALRDDAEIAKRSKAVERASDPIDKLKALAALQQASAVDEGPLREGFVANAKSWAEAQGVPTAAFRELKVPDEVLRAAGFSLPVPGRAGGGRGGGRGGRGGRRAKAVSVEEIKAHVLGRKGTFVLADVMTGVGGSQATVRKAIDELIDAGDVVKRGPVPHHASRGRAPLLYART